MIDYIAIMQKYHGGRNDGLRPSVVDQEGFITDVPKSIQLSDDDYVRVRYDAKAMRWIPNRPSRIKYPTAKQLIKQYRQEYAERLI
jgi:hypothetical protein